MTRVYYKEAVGAFIVFDATRPATFETVQRWKEDLAAKIQLKDGKPIPMFLIANKVGQLFMVFFCNLLQVRSWQRGSSQQFDRDGYLL